MLVEVPEGTTVEPLTVVKLLNGVIEAAQTRYLGKQAIDDGYNQTGQMLAALLSWPLAVCVRSGPAGTSG